MDGNKAIQGDYELGFEASEEARQEELYHYLNDVRTEDLTGEKFNY